MCSRAHTEGVCRGGKGREEPQGANQLCCSSMSMQSGKVELISLPLLLSQVGGGEETYNCSVIAGGKNQVSYPVWRGRALKSWVHSCYGHGSQQGVWCVPGQHFKRKSSPNFCLNLHLNQTQTCTGPFCNPPRPCVNRLYWEPITRIGCRKPASTLHICDPSLSHQFSKFPGNNLKGQLIQNLYIHVGLMSRIRKSLQSYICNWVPISTHLPWLLQGFTSVVVNFLNRGLGYGPQHTPKGDTVASLYKDSTLAHR